ncbi:hypothetical protein AC1031_014911 [Aphanomyces cochlioides]|nr:hypothetical protein AC1031_014911 [Aphanomyces cochlioides]
MTKAANYRMITMAEFTTSYPSMSSNSTVSSICTGLAVLRSTYILINGGTPLFDQAYRRDLNRHPQELFVIELAGQHAELQEHLDYLDDWVAPEKVSNNMANMPRWSAIVSDPLGVCCIIDTSNYPVRLLFGPPMGGIGSGNCASGLLLPPGTCDHVTAVMSTLTDGVQFSAAMLQHQFGLIFVTGEDTLAPTGSSSSPSPNDQLFLQQDFSWLEFNALCCLRAREWIFLSDVRLPQRAKGGHSVWRRR